jgi:hypothetical protein
MPRRPPPASDNVPTSGLWQTDPELKRLQADLFPQMMNPVATDPRGGRFQQEAKANADYVEANRGRLGIPDNYTPDPRDNGESLYDPNQNAIRDIVLTGAAMGTGGYALGSVLGPLGSIPAGTTTPGVVTANQAALQGVIPSVAGPAGGNLASQAGNMSFLSSLFGGKGLDPTAMLLTGLSMFGGGGDGEDREGFKGNVDPTRLLQEVMQSTRDLGSRIQSRGPTQMRPLPGPPKPINVPGLPFQIGGGFGADPMTMNEQLQQMLQPQNPTNQAKPSNPTNQARRRNPIA